MAPLFPDLSLARALEGAEAASSHAFCKAAAEVYEDKDIAALPCGGGVCLYYGPADPLNAVKGMGLDGPVNLDEWTAVEKFLEARKSPVVIDLCPFADEPFVECLGARGYKIGSFETVTCRDLDEPDPAPDESTAGTPIASFEITRIDPTNIGAIAAWSEVVGRGFADGGEPFKFAVDFGKVRTHMMARALKIGIIVPESARPSKEMTASHIFLATFDGIPAGGAGMSIHDSFRVAHFSGAAVLPQFRRRGIQTALTAARLKLARERGCRYAKLDVRAGSISHHNAIRAGFQIAYTRPQMVRSW